MKERVTKLVDTGKQKQHYVRKKKEKKARQQKTKETQIKTMTQLDTS